MGARWSPDQAGAVDPRVLPRRRESGGSCGHRVENEIRMWDSLENEISSVGLLENEIRRK